MKSKAEMDQELQKQLDRSIVNIISVFNKDETLKNVRKLYIDNFQYIKELLKTIDKRIVMNQIVEINPSLKPIMMGRDIFQVLLEVNRGIKEGKIQIKDIVL